jgi:hypothetical protein
MLVGAIRARWLEQEITLVDSICKPTGGCVISVTQNQLAVKPLPLHLLLMLFSFSLGAQSIFPLAISANKRYFVTRQGQPFLYHADTGWQIFTQLTFEEADEYLTFRKAQGFNTIQVQIVMSPEQVNRYGQKPFLGDQDFSRPNEAYHDHIARVLRLAEEKGLLMVMSQPWLGCCKEAFGNTPEKPIQKNGPVKNRLYGQYLGKKFAAFNNLFWIGGGDNDPKGDREALVAFLEGLRAAAPAHQLITYHASTTHSSTDLFQYAPWLGFSFIYTYWPEKTSHWVVPELMPHVYESALGEWAKSDVMPFVLGESQYEGSGVIENDTGTPQMVRRQAYWTMLCGGAGHAYGSDLWNFPANWRDILRYPGAYQMQHLIRIFSTLPWWTLTPDLPHRAVVNGYGQWTTNNYVTTAVSEDKKLLVAYLPELQPVWIDFGYLAGTKFTGAWIDPATGETKKEFTITQKSVQRVAPANGSDWLLVIKGSD